MPMSLHNATHMITTMTVLIICMSSFITLWREIINRFLIVWDSYGGDTRVGQFVMGAVAVPLG